ncbi:hypothetical protein TNIN_280761 [Trichonephila inaurata madagascariensis]|uniref:Uncharacterized protein n=1 Tax=Trichonephila inaurata madagascariensis TaxID=2747483 RepID=A0A8X6Y795_9ARAC|nr:hypothetical protein TNIN_280761 [Trichonephila inaurata madagascariensis]
MCVYCFRTWYRLRLNDLIYLTINHNGFLDYDPSESAEMRNEDTVDGSMFFPLEHEPQQLEDSSFANLETIPVCPSGDFTSEIHSEETLPSTSVQKSSDIKIMNEPSDMSFSTENEAAKYEDTPSSSGSLVGSVKKMDNKDVLVLSKNQAAKAWKSNDLVPRKM